MTVRRKRGSPLILPALAMRGLVVFPHMTIYFDVGRPASIEALTAAMEEDGTIFLVAQRDLQKEQPGAEDLYEIGVVAKVRQLLRVAEDAVRVQVEGLYRARVLSCAEGRSYLLCRIQPEAGMTGDPEDMQVVAYARICKELFRGYCEAAPHMPSNLRERVMDEKHPAKLYELMVHNLPFGYEEKQQLLEKDSLLDGLSRLAQILHEETGLLETEQQILSQVHENMDNQQRDYFLREQMRVISEELGEEEPQAEADAFREQIEAIEHISDDSRKKLLQECKRYTQLPANSQEAAVIRTYLETVLELPFDQVDPERVDINRAREILDRDHYGLVKVKERILETLAVRQLYPNGKGNILCLVGPPGVGKTSIARSVAESLGRKYVRVSLGGVRDESDIRGHRKTYVAAMPGRIIDAMRQAGSRNPLFLLDEVDKLGNDFRGDPASALLEVLDREQNVAFRDHYVEIPFDLSDVFFIATANTADTIPAALLDRMEVIYLSSYTREEKFEIAKRHLVKKQRAAHGLTARQCRISDAALYAMIDYYTREAGVRKLEQEIASVCRKAAKVIVSGEQSGVSVSGRQLEVMLGPKKYRPEQIPAQNEVGLVNGLAWTSVGGELLPIEVSVLEGSGKLLLTGNLGDVMKESAQAAVSYVRGVAAEYGISPDFYQKKDIHIHAPEGAVPKDGPSAGVALAVALTSALGGFPVRREIAMTGEITLRGKVLAIGGLKEKAIAAYRAGAKTVLIPRDNLPDLEELPDSVRETLTFLPMDEAADALHTALVRPAVPLKPEAKRTHTLPPVKHTERPVVCGEAR